MNDDGELIARILDGAKDEFAELVRRHQSQVFSILHRYERDPSRLDDLAQETFLKAWKALDRFDGRAPFAHWLARIAVHVAIDHLRRHKRRPQEVAMDFLGFDAGDWLHDEAGSRAIEASDARELLDLAMRGLSPAEHLVIVLLEIEGRSVKEVSALTGSSGIAVRVRAARARAKMRRTLDGLKEASS